MKRHENRNPNDDFLLAMSFLQERLVANNFWDVDLSKTWKNCRWCQCLQVGFVHLSPFVATNSLEFYGILMLLLVMLLMILIIFLTLMLLMMNHPLPWHPPMFFSRQIDDVGFYWLWACCWCEEKLGCGKWWAVDVQRCDIWLYLCVLGVSQPRWRSNHVTVSLFVFKECTYVLYIYIYIIFCKTYIPVVQFASVFYISLAFFPLTCKASCYPYV